MTTFVQQTRMVRPSKEGYRWFCNLWEVACSKQYDHIEIQIIGYMDANLASVLGGLTTKIRNNLSIPVSFTCPPQVDKQQWTILKKNNFLFKMGAADQQSDTYGTTIPYTVYEPKFENEFMRSILNFESKGVLPVMANDLKHEFRKNLMEIFSNASIHSRTLNGIHVCGQHFPKRNRIDFTICDMGIGIMDHVNESMGTTYTAMEAIHWVMEGRNTTKVGGPIPGGIGLKLLREFIKLNNGKMQILSNSGFWEQTASGSNSVSLPLPFPGTMVNLEINTNAVDQKHYLLAARERK